MRDRIEFDWKGPHHVYLGTFMVLYGCLMIAADYGAFGCAFTALGVLIAADDVVEHALTVDTPLRILFEKVIYPLMLKFNSRIKELME